jgi:hypothetical protein
MIVLPTFIDTDDLFQEAIPTFHNDLGQLRVLSTSLPRKMIRPALSRLNRSNLSPLWTDPAGPLPSV